MLCKYRPPIGTYLSDCYFDPASFLVQPTHAREW